MSILIKGMDMPKCCVKCPLLFDETFYCMAVGKSIPTQAIQNSEIAEWCPIVEVPTPHGRLIDEKSLFKQYPGKVTHHHKYGFDWEIHNAKAWLEEWVPTIIEAEELNNDKKCKDRDRQ